MVLLYRSDWPFLCGWYPLVVRCFAPDIAHAVAKNFLTNRVLLPVRRYIGMLYGMSQWRMKRLALRVAIVFDIGTTPAIWTINPS